MDNQAKMRTSGTLNKIVVVSDSFKGTISSAEICEIARESVKKFFPECQVQTIPVADGGEGTVACFVDAAGAVPVKVTVSGPYGEPVEAVYGRMGTKAVVEMAATAGLPMVGDRKNPEMTTTFGVGELIRHAVMDGCTEILLGLGGSATNDGGCGCAAALGVEFLDETGTPFVPVGQTLKCICQVDDRQARELLKNVSITIMSDVDNPLYGPRGAAHIFGPQKGADPAMIQRLDESLQHLDQVIYQEYGRYTNEIPGAGAAGGMGAGCIAFLGATIKSGIDAILDMVEFDRCLDGADLVLTGEGKIDSQSIHGKLISGIARRTSARKIPLVALVGAIGEDAADAYDLGVTAMFGIDRNATAFESYAHRSAEFYRRTLEDLLRLLKAL